MHINTDHITRQSGTFRAVKVTLIVFQILLIVGAIIIIAGFMGMGEADEQLASEQKGMRFGGAILFVVVILVMLIAMLGLYGSIKENFNLVVAYGVILTLSVIGGFVNGNYLGSILNLFSAGLAFYFAFLINRVRGQNIAENKA